MKTNKNIEIYPINNEIDSELINNCANINWAEMYIIWKKENLLNRYLSLIKNSEMENFILGVQYEYGINVKQDLKKAYNIYLSSATNTFDTLSMYRIHLIHLKDYKKFDVKRDRILEKFYLFKSFCYSSFDIMNVDKFFSNNFNIANEIIQNLDLEDNDNLDKFKSLIQFLRNNEKYGVEIIILNYIKSIILYYFNKNEEDKKEGIELLKITANNNYYEALYKLICINIEPNDKKLALENYKILENVKYYRCYAKYGKLLFEEFHNVKKSLEILQIGYENKNFDCLIYFIDVYSYYNNNFEKQNANIYFKLMELILDSISFGEKYSFFELIYLRKLLIEKFDKKEEYDKRYLPYLIEIVNFFINTIENNKIEYIKNNFQDDSDSEFNFVLGVLYYYGVDNIIITNYEKSIKYIKAAYKILDTLSYKRFLYSYIYKIRKKLYNQNKITLEKLKKTERKLFNMFYDSLDGCELDSFSCSYLYFIGKLYMKGIGTKKNLSLAYCFIDKAKTNKVNIGYGSIITHYRCWKSKKKLLENELQSVEKMLNNLDLKNDNESYGKEGNICGICYVNKRNKVIIPCFHKVCSTCMNKINDKCPFCRGKILFIKEIKN